MAAILKKALVSVRKRASQLIQKSSSRRSEPPRILEVPQKDTKTLLAEMSIGNEPAHTPSAPEPREMRWPNPPSRPIPPELLMDMVTDVIAASIDALCNARSEADVNRMAWERRVMLIMSSVSFELREIAKEVIKNSLNVSVTPTYGR